MCRYVWRFSRSVHPETADVSDVFPCSSKLLYVRARSCTCRRCVNNLGAADFFALLAIARKFAADRRAPPRTRHAHGVVGDESSQQRTR